MRMMSLPLNKNHNIETMFEKVTKVQWAHKSLWTSLLLWKINSKEKRPDHQRKERIRPKEKPKLVHHRNRKSLWLNSLNKFMDQKRIRLSKRWLRRLLRDCKKELQKVSSMNRMMEWSPQQKKDLERLLGRLPEALVQQNKRIKDTILLRIIAHQIMTLFQTKKSSTWKSTKSRIWTNFPNSNKNLIALQLKEANHPKERLKVETKSIGMISKQTLKMLCKILVDKPKGKLVLVTFFRDRELMLVVNSDKIKASFRECLAILIPTLMQLQYQQTLGKSSVPHWKRAKIKKERPRKVDNRDKERLGKVRELNLRPQMQLQNRRVTYISINLK